MKALVTGSTGFIGAAVARCLLEHGVEVRVLVRRDSDLGNLQGLKVEQAYGDLRDIASLRQAVAGCRHVYHVAAHYAFWAKDPRIFYDINVAGTSNLTEARSRRWCWYRRSAPRRRRARSGFRPAEA